MDTNYLQYFKMPILKNYETNSYTYSYYTGVFLINLKNRKWKEWLNVVIAVVLELEGLFSFFMQGNINGEKYSQFGN